MTGSRTPRPVLIPAAPYSCPGLSMPRLPGEPLPGLVACVRAGHACPPAAPIVTQTVDRILTSWRCPCCGELGRITSMPRNTLAGAAGGQGRRGRRA